MQTTNSPTLLVLAAGMGSRYGGLKQMDPVGPDGETIIDYSVFDSLRAGFGRLVFVIRREMEEPFRESFGARFERLVPVEYAFQQIDELPVGFHAPAGRTKPWGTAHAVLSAAGAIEEPFAVINADDFYGAGSFSVLADHLRLGSANYAMVGFVLRETLSEFGSVSRGICRVNSSGELEQVVELTRLERRGAGARNVDTEGRVTDLTGDELASMNMWGFHPDVFEQLERYFRKFLRDHGTESQSECFLPAAVNDLVATGQASVKVLRTNSTWFGVTYREDHAMVVERIRRLIQVGAYPEKLWQ